MSRFVIVNEAPKNLTKDEYLIVMPDFMDEIQQSHHKTGATGIAGAGYLRHILTLIGNKYDLNFSSYSDVPVTRYIGVAIKSDVDVSKLIVRMFEDSYPAMIDSYITYQIKHRPDYVKLIYFVGPIEKGKLFHLEGFAPLDHRELKALNSKDKKPKRDQELQLETEVPDEQ